MTFWAKLLTVILFALSIAFAAASGVLFAKREDFRGQLEAAKRDHAREIEALNRKVGELDGDLAAKKNELQNATTDLTARRLQIQKLTGDVTQLRGQVQKLETDAAAQRNLAAKLAQDVKALTNRNGALAKENESVTKENRTLHTNLRTERTRTSTLEKANAALIGERDELKVNLADAKKQIDEDEEIFAALAERNIEARTVIGMTRIIPEVKARVASVDLKNGLVVLNVGSKQGVKKNFEFTVFRDDKFIATINVFHLQDDYSAARIITKKDDVQLGDDAWTRLP